MQNLPEQEKAVAEAMPEERKSEVIAQFTDDVLSKLTGAFVDMCAIERWTKRDLSLISGMNETAIGHILAGRRKNLTLETIALLARSLQTRPELILHDTRPTGNEMQSGQNDSRALLFPRKDQTGPRNAKTVSSAYDRLQQGFSLSDVQGGAASAEEAAYAQPELHEEAL